jgi:IS605 OrfB family transposase
MRFRLYPTPEQETGLLFHASHARLIWNALVEQSQSWRRDKRGFPSWSEQSRQITEARCDIDWVGAGNREVQEKALRDFHLAMEAFWRGQHGHPTWRQRGVHESFRMSGVQPYHVRRLNRRWSQVHVQQIGAVRFRGTRPVGNPRSFVIRRDQAGRWWVSFPMLPVALEVSGGAPVGIDRGVVRTIALSDGSHSQAPSLTRDEDARMRRLQRQMSRRTKGSNRRARSRLAIAKLRAKEADRVKDWIETQTTDLIRHHDFIAIEALNTPGMTRRGRWKRGLNRAILFQRWGLFAQRLEQKGPLAGVPVIRVPAAYTSQRCSACGHTARENRESQAVFRCRSCGHTDNADTNAALNILAAGLAVAARGGVGYRTEPANREPKPLSKSGGGQSVGSAEGD